MGSEGSAPRGVPLTASGGGKQQRTGDEETLTSVGGGENPAEGQVGSGLSRAVLAWPRARTERSDTPRSRGT